MVSVQELKKIHLVRDLDEDELERLRPLCSLRIFSEKSVLFEEGQEADTFYMLLTGKVLLEVRLAQDIMISLGSVKPGYSFGWSSLFRESRYTSSAVCAEPSEVIEMPSEPLLTLMEEDPIMGYRFMKGALDILRSRLIRRTDQFLKTLRMHPDIQALFVG